jgi:hypothetical protein
MGAYRGHPPNFLSVVRRLSPISAYNLGLGLEEGPRRNIKALKYIVAAGEGIANSNPNILDRYLGLTLCYTV